VTLRLLCCASTLFMAVFCATSQAPAGMVTLTNGTATFSQQGVLTPDQAVDGLVPLDGTNGWAILQLPSGITSAETAVWETSSDIVGANVLTFTMQFNHPLGDHALGRFRFSVTTDDRSEFADDLNTGGDVTANWSVLSDPNVTVPAGMTFSVLADESILTAGTIGTSTTYIVTYLTTVSGITGIRLEAMEDPSLPTNGPGHYTQGNFVLTELTLDASEVPEPSSFALLAMGGLAFVTRRRRLRVRSAAGR